MLDKKLSMVNVKSGNWQKESTDKQTQNRRKTDSKQTLWAFACF